MRVLAVGCHPDDLEICCSGTLAKCVKRGDTVIACHVANGDKGHIEIMPKELADIRRQEAKNAGALAGIEMLSCEVPDLMVDSNNMETRNKLVDIIRYARPDFIITTAPDDYMRDHIETSKLVFDASFGATVPHLVTEHSAIDKAPPIFYMEDYCGLRTQPTIYVDITDTIETKMQMLREHKSQIDWLMDHDKVDFVENTRTINRFRGLQAGVPYAEGFTQCLVALRATTQRYLP